MADVVNKEFALHFVQCVNEDLSQIKQPHFDIAFRLNEAKSLGYPEVLGYEDIYQLADCEFALGKTSVKNYIAVATAFMHGAFLLEQWESFSYTALVEMLPMDDYDRKQIKPDMTVKQIREYKANHKFVALPDGSYKLASELTEKDRQSLEYNKSQLTDQKKHDAFIKQSLLLKKHINSFCITYGYEFSELTVEVLDALVTYLLLHGVTSSGEP